MHQKTFPQNVAGAALALSFVSPAAFADMNLLQDLRSIVGFGEVADANGVYDTGSLQFDAITEVAPFAQWEQSAGAGGSIGNSAADGYGWQNSSMTSTLISGSARANASAINDGTAASATSAGISELTAVFSIDASTTFRVEGSWGISDLARGSVLIRETGTNDTMLQRNFDTDGNYSIDELLTLEAGTYYISYALSASTTLEFESETKSANGTMDASFSVVPAPGAVGVLALSGFGVARRRRLS